MLNEPCIKWSSYHYYFFFYHILYFKDLELRDTQRVECGSANHQGKEDEEESCQSTFLEFIHDRKFTFTFIFGHRCAHDLRGVHDGYIK